MAIERVPNCGWRLIFATGLMENFFEWERCADIRTYREGSNNFKRNQRIEGHFMEGMGLSLELEVLLDTEVVPLRDIRPGMRDFWGRAARSRTSLKQMTETMRGYYPEITEDTVVSFNVLRLAKNDGNLIRHSFPNDLREQLKQQLQQRGKD